MQGLYAILLLIVSNVFMTFCLVWPFEVTRNEMD